MKTLTLILLTLISLASGAQTLNDKGKYIDTEGELFSGVISKVQDGIRSEFSVKEGVINGEANYYFASGKLMETGSFTDGQKDQKWLRYNEAGNVTAIAFYQLGKKNGTWLVFDEKGNKRFEMNYSSGQKTGIWTSWDESGKVLDQKDHGSLN